MARLLFAAIFCVTFSFPSIAFERGDLVSFNLACKNLTAAIFLANTHDRVGDGEELSAAIDVIIQNGLCRYSKELMTSFAKERLYSAEKKGDAEVWSIDSDGEIFVILAREDGDSV